ncbi:hypothetical protein B7C42_08260 [Nocardia cerradoensis]|uniref:Uncharacterized protein n=1 Tax=Nocardia cerradoensis TaxID=85688 RepID=A0A231GT67_9NOCA|nr:hypothetical protein B7C42_08260 [Nocardia cerradoensis]
MFGQLGAYVGGVCGAGDVGDESFVSGLVFAGDDGGLFDAVELGEGGSDFAAFDAVAADFDLFVGACDVVELAVVFPVDEVSGAVHAGAGSSVWARHEP